MKSNSKITGLVLASTAIVVGGKWAQHKTIDSKVITGGVILAVGLVAINGASPNMADKFAWLILLAVLGNNADAIFKALGGIVTSPTALSVGNKVASTGVKTTSAPVNATAPNIPRSV